VIPRNQEVSGRTLRHPNIYVQGVRDGEDETTL
jgi:hypothetical protein